MKSNPREKSRGMVSNPSKVKNSSSGATLDGHISKEVWVGRKIHRLAGSFLFPDRKILNPSKVYEKNHHNN